MARNSGRRRRARSRSCGGFRGRSRRRRLHREVLLGVNQRRQSPIGLLAAEARLAYRLFCAHQRQLGPVDIDLGHRAGVETRPRVFERRLRDLDARQARSHDLVGDRRRVVGLCDAEEDRRLGGFVVRLGGVHAGLHRLQRRIRGWRDEWGRKTDGAVELVLGLDGQNLRGTGSRRARGKRERELHVVARVLALRGHGRKQRRPGQIEVGLRLCEAGTLGQQTRVRPAGHGQRLIEAQWARGLSLGLDSESEAQSHEGDRTGGDSCARAPLPHGAASKGSRPRPPPPMTSLAAGWAATTGIISSAPRSTAVTEAMDKSER